MTMYKEEDRKIADDILMKLKKSHQVDESDMLEYMNKIYGLPRDAPEFERLCCVLWREMEGMGLIRNTNHKMTLTSEGHIAAKIGVTEYLLRYEKDRELDVMSKKTSIWNHIVSIANVLIAAAAWLVGWIMGSF